VNYAIESQNLTRYFKKFCAVDHLDLRVRSGEIYGLLGPNGAGKTTAIKMFCGLLRPSAGEMGLLGGKVPDRSIKSRIGYMPQETALYQGLSIHQNLAFFGEIHGMPKKSILEREKELLSFVDLAGWRDALVQTLSGGMKHRASLACALIHQPMLLFLDEPTVGVDPRLRVSFWEYFHTLKARGITILITTHYMDEARHCDRVGFMREGKLIAEGSPDELLNSTGTTSLEDAFLACAAGGNGR
jgi:ABC-2 type transport system ATP-binding protein